MSSTRRTFLQSGFAMAAAFAGPQETSAQPAPTPRWLCGLGLNGFMSSAHQFQKSYPIEEVLDFAVREGFDGIELVDGWPSGRYPSPDEPSEVAKLKKMYDQCGLRIYTIQTGGAGAYAASAETRKTWLKTFADQVRLCRQLGCDFIGHWPGTVI